MAQALSIVIVNYNGSAFLENCLRSFGGFLDLNNIAHEFLILDNASTDDSVEIIKRIASEFLNVKPVFSEINHGFGSANNILIEMAAYATVVLLNNDTLTIDLQELCNKAKNSLLEKNTIYSCSILNADHSIQKNTFSYPKVFNILIDVFLVKKLFYSAYKFLFKERLQVLNGYYSGCYLVMKADVFKKAGGFDPDFFFYHEECDLFLRLEKLGIQKELLKDRIVHYGSGGIGISDFAFKNYYVNLARLLIKNHYGSADLIKLIFKISFHFRILLLLFGFKIPYSPFSHMYKSNAIFQSSNKQLIALHKETLAQISGLHYSK
ncbi:glycosyltransferase family 2 protein [Pedobacter psychroterrae]|nr:glycosyltransferase family 2 protein [Pedobacter psychroterrae]